LLIEKESKFVRFHGIQSIATYVVFFVVYIVLWFIPIIGWIINIFHAIAMFHLLDSADVQSLSRQDV
jgi:uncharacterized membrane protein